jgi:DNA invertase Pin-like site-specific DNA recombinase
MPAPIFVAYLRVSTARQGRSGLGLEAQRDAVERYILARGGKSLGEYLEVESGKRDDRPQLQRALEFCRATGACLLVARLDRLARNARFLLAVVEGSGKGGVEFADMELPPGHSGKLILTMMAAVAEYEGKLIASRTKAALAAAKARGVKLGNPNLGLGSRPGAAIASAAAKRQADDRVAKVLPFITAARKAGAVSLGEIAQALNNRGVQAPRGGKWSAAQVLRVERRVAEAQAA